MMGLETGREKPADIFHMNIFQGYIRTRMAKIKYLPSMKKGKGRTSDRGRHDEMNELVEYRFCILMVIRR